MFQDKSTVIWVCICLAAGLAAAGRASAEQGIFPVVVLAADGSGDYGPQTPGTTTAGWQEAINYCVANHLDLYVKGGGTFQIYDTILIPPTQDFRIDGGAYTLNWVGPSNKDMIVVDSGMDHYMTLGSLVYSGTGAAIRFKPVNPVPIDGFPVMIDSEIRIASIKAGAQQTGAGVVFDASSAGIYHAKYYFGNIEGFAVGITTSSSGSVAHNIINCPHLHSNVSNASLLRLYGGANQNVISVNLAVDSGATGVKGVDLYGTNNVIQVILRSSFSAGNALILQGSAAGNQVSFLQLPSVSDPSSLVTDSASAASNQITWTGAPAAVRTISPPAGVYTYTQRLYPATARVVGGTITSVRLQRGSDTIDFGTSRGDVYLSVGDTLQVNSTVAPTIYIIPRLN